MTRVKTILVVEDEEILREAYQKILSREGYDVVCAADGIEALACLERVAPDLILLDMLMPHMDGLTFLERAGLQRRYPHTKVVAFSNLSSQDGLASMLCKGATMQLLKSSLSPKQLVAVVSELTSEKQPVRTASRDPEPSH